MAEWKVVILEPDTEVARSHWRCLASLNGFVPVGVARSAEQALEMVATLRPHLLIMDVELPGENGLALLRRLRAAGSAVEAVVVTATRAEGPCSGLAKSMLRVCSCWAWNGWST